MSQATIALCGNPNCGKTTLFNALTGARQHVGNWPGVTVDKKTGEYRHGGGIVEVVDLPGIYSLDLPHGASSVDEQIARDYILSGEPGLVVNIVDGANLERNLYLTSQLLEMRVPMLVAVNMMDKARRLGLQIDLAGLSAQLGCPVVPLVASRESGVAELREAAARAIAEPQRPATAIAYGSVLDRGIAELLPLLRERAETQGVDPHWLALKLLEGESLALQLGTAEACDKAQAWSREVEAQTGDEVDILLADARYDFVHGVVRHCQHAQGEVARNLTGLIDRVVLNRALGIPIFLVVMYLMFMFTIKIGGAFVDFFDQAAAALFVDGAKALLSHLGSPGWLEVVLADGLGGGVRTVASFIPIVGFLFLFLSVLEDSGYMARAAFVMDRLMRGVGLPGKSFVPLIVGFGCNVPAIMATRTLETSRDRLLTVLMAPFMSCGARLPVYALFAAAFFPVGGQNLVFLLYLIGIAVAVLTGLVMKSTLLRGESAPFVMEMPTYHLPTAKGVGIRTLERTSSFVVKAGGIIVPMVMVLAVLNSTGINGSFGNENTDRSVLSQIGRGLTPVFQPMGVRDDNWPATVGVFTGILAKEAVVGTLNTLYTELGADPAGRQAAAAPFNLWSALGAAVASIPTNVAAALGSASDPLGMNIGDVSNAAQAAKQQAVAVGTFSAMVARFDGRIGAFAYLLFILLYSPCTAATAAIYREVGGRWSLFVVAWTTGLAWSAGTLAYQAGTFAAHPAASTAWLLGILSVLAAVLWTLRSWGRRRGRAAALAVG